MGRFLRQYDKDYMRMAILKQEETFREQVNELHRLYRVQKLLMQDVTTASELHARRQVSRDRRWRSAAALLDLEIPASDGSGEEEDGADVELTLATGRSSCRTGGRKNANSSDSGSGASFSSSTSTDGSGSASGRDNLDVRDWGLWYSTPMEEDQEPLAVAVRHGRGDEQRPSMQLQYLSLNMT